MKRRIFALLTLMVMLLTFAASAETEIDRTGDRQIALQEVTENTVPEGISPTTGLELSTYTVPEGFTGMALTGRYLPMMVQVGNDEGGLEWRAPWGLNYADVVYELPLYKYGATRFTGVFNDLVPDSVGFVRSARVGNVWLWKEWGAGFAFYGQQETPGSDVVEEFKKLGHYATNDPILFSGMVGKNKAWYKYYTAREGLKNPYNVDANLSGMYSLIPEDYVAPNHTFKFADEPLTGDAATEVLIQWTNEDELYGAKLLYNADQNVYERYVRVSGKRYEPWVELDNKEKLTFTNVIIQFIDLTWNRGMVNAPIVEMVGEGNADFFMNGQHAGGYWKRADMDSRTVYYGPDGNEMELQPGKTLVIFFPKDSTEERHIIYQ